jgi:hypothetical protein
VRPHPRNVYISTINNLQRNAKLQPILLIILIILISGCLAQETQELKVNLSANTTAREIVPEKIPGYTSLNLPVTTQLAAVDIAKNAADLIGYSPSIVHIGTTFGTVSVTPFYVMKSVINTIACYEDYGAVNPKIYYRQKTADTLYVGAMLAGDKNQITDPILGIGCISTGFVKGLFSAAQPPPEGMKFCSETFKIVTLYNEFYVFIFGNYEGACDELCHSLPACPRPSLPSNS